MRKIALILLVLCFPFVSLGATTSPTSSPTSIPTTKPAPNPLHALLIRHGKIVDGAGNGWYYGDVLIRGNRIAAVGTIAPMPGVEEIDATGLVVAPGFIDVHTHADNDVLRSPLAENFVRDGVTTIVTGNCGYGVRNVGRYFDAIRERGAAINVATFVGHNTVLEAVKGGGAARLTPDQMAHAKSLIDQAMRDGAVGMSTGLIYRPGMFSPPEEIIELQKVAAGYGGIYASHMRNEGNEILAAIDEALRVGREAHCRVEISHFKLPSDVAKKIGGATTTLGKVMGARLMGEEVWLDQYPYTASSTNISVLLPDWVYDKGNDEAKQRLNDPAQVAKILADMKKNYEDARHRPNMGYAVISSYRFDPKLDGRNIYEVAQIAKYHEQNPAGGSELLSADPEKMPEVSMDDQYRAIIDICKHGGASCVFHTMDEQEVEDILRCPLVSIASDSGIRDFGVGQPHPRGYGTNARVLGHYVRERHTISLEDAVRKMTSQPATAFRFMDRGLIRENYIADLTIFDANTITDKATFDQPHQYSQGIRYVVVNGYPVLADGKMTGILSGGPVTGPGFSAKRVALNVDSPTAVQAASDR